MPPLAPPDKAVKRHPLIPFALVALALVACGGGSPFDGQTVADPEGIQVTVASADFGVGQPRVPLVLYSGLDRVADAQAVGVTAYDLSTDPPTPGWTGDAVNYSDYEVPYWVVYPELPAAGFWGLGIEVTLAGGEAVQAEVSLEAVAQASAPQVGDTPPASHNRTLDTQPDINLLTSADDPLPALYQMTVAQALESGRPSVVTFATPRYCTSRLCAPVVDSVEAVQPDYAEQVNFIHVEIFKDFDTLDYADEVAEWGLPSEPWTYVLDRDGVIVARLGGPVSPRELREALEPLL